MGLARRIREMNNDVEIKLEDVLDYVRTKVLRLELGLDLEKLKSPVTQYTVEYLKEHHPYMMGDEEYVDKLTKTVYDRLYGLGPIEKHLKNPDVTDIIVIGTNILYVENGIKKDDPDTFLDYDDAKRVMDKIASAVGKTVNIAEPITDAELYDGSRALLVGMPTSDRPVMAIRKHTFSSKTLEELRPGLQGLTDEIIEYLKKQVEDKKNFVIIGQTGSGKTTFTNALTFSIQKNHIVAVLEDTRELKLPLKYVYYFQTREGGEDTPPITWSDILKACLRANPNRIILTEIRTPAAAYEFINVLNTGHKGSMTTIHASNAALGLERLEMLIKEHREMDDISLRKLIANAVDIVVFLDIIENEEGDSVGRIIRELVELKGVTEDGHYDMHYIVGGGE